MILETKCDYNSYKQPHEGEVRKGYKNMNSIFLLVVSSAMILETTIVVGLIVYFIRNGNLKNNSSYEDGIFQIKEVFEQELRDLAIKYAEEKAAFDFFEQFDGKQIDIAQICNEAQKRALALSIKGAETAIAMCENNLKEIRSSISENQKMVASGHGSFRNVVLDMKTQEGFAMKHLEEARVRFDILIEAGKSATQIHVI